MHHLAALQILIVASNASAQFGGEAILGLHYFRKLSQRGIPVRLLTHHRNAEELSTRADLDAESIFFVPDTRWHRLTWRVVERLPDRVRDLIGGAFMSVLDGFYQSRMIHRLVTRGLVDLIHQPTPVSPLMPSDLHRFGVPLVIGPMNGGIDYPPGYEDYEGRGSKFAIALGRRVALLLNRLVPGKCRASVLLVANERTRAALPTARHPNVQTLVENGIDFTTWHGPPRDEGILAPPGRLRLAYVGRLVRWKAIDITFRAIIEARRRGADITLEVLGDGEERGALEALAHELGLGDHVFFHGYREQAFCAEVLGRSDALVLNSLRECGGAAVLEAMAMSLPVVASAWGGPQDYLTSECGILVSPTPRETFPGRLAGAFMALANDPARRRKLGVAGHAIVHRHYDWDHKIDRIIEVYHAALHSRRQRKERPLI